MPGECEQKRATSRAISLVARTLSSRLDATRRSQSTKSSCAPASLLFGPPRALSLLRANIPY